MKEMTDVVPALPEDEDALYSMLLELHEENGIFKVSEPKVRAGIREATEMQGGIIRLIRGEVGLEASMGLIIEQFWYTDEWSLLEKWLFVRPGHRHKRHASALIDDAKRVADQLGLVLQAGIMSTERTAAKERMYRRKMTPVGGWFMYQPGASTLHTGGLH